jgi:hypothetical protein
MPQGDRFSYIDRQHPQPERIETDCEGKGLSAKTAAGRGLATARKFTGGEKYGGSGRNAKERLIVYFSRQPAFFALRLGNAH